MTLWQVSWRGAGGDGFGLDLDFALVRRAGWRRMNCIWTSLWGDMRPSAGWTRGQEDLPTLRERGGAGYQRRRGLGRAAGCHAARGVAPGAAWKAATSSASFFLAAFRCRSLTWPKPRISSGMLAIATACARLSAPS